MLGAGASRRRIVRTLNAAYADGLLSEETFTYRIDQLLAGRVIDPRRLIGDLSFRRTGGWRVRLQRIAAALTRAEVLLALDWSGATGELIVGRHHGCDVILDHPTVSRRHARLVFRDGSWLIQDLESTNGILVNGAPVRRCALRPGDSLVLGEALLRID